MVVPHLHYSDAAASVSMTKMPPIRGFDAALGRCVNPPRRGRRRRCRKPNSRVKQHADEVHPTIAPTQFTPSNGLTHDDVDGLLTSGRPLTEATTRLADWLDDNADGLGRLSVSELPAQPPGIGRWDCLARPQQEMPASTRPYERQVPYRLWDKAQPRRLPLGSMSWRSR